MGKAVSPPSSTSSKKYSTVAYLTQTTYTNRITTRKSTIVFSLSSLQCCQWAQPDERTKEKREKGEGVLERSSIGCLKTKTKVIILAIYKEHRQFSEPIETRSKHLQLRRSAGNICMEASNDSDWMKKWRVFLTHRRFISHAHGIAAYSWNMLSAVSFLISASPFARQLFPCNYSRIYLHTLQWFKSLPT